MVEEINSNDTEGNGFCSKDEMKGTITEYLEMIGETATQGEIDKVFLEMDTDKDGRITLDEYYNFGKLKVENVFLP